MTLALVTPQSPVMRPTRTVTWPNLGANELGEAFEINRDCALSIQVVGEFDGARLRWLGSNDAVVYSPLNDKTGLPINLVSPGFSSLLEETLTVRPQVEGGNLKTSIRVNLLLRKGR